jgi:hypothetical protein
VGGVSESGEERWWYMVVGRNRTGWVGWFDSGVRQWKAFRSNGSWDGLWGRLSRFQGAFGRYCERPELFESLQSECNSTFGHNTKTRNAGAMLFTFPQLQKQKSHSLIRRLPH